MTITHLPLGCSSARMNGPGIELGVNSRECSCETDFEYYSEGVSGSDKRREDGG